MLGPILIAPWVVVVAVALVALVDEHSRRLEAEAAAEAGPAAGAWTL